MHRVAKSDLWYRSYRLEPGGRYDYQFQLNYDRLIADPLNPKRAPTPGEFSELAMPGWREPLSIREPAAGAPRGTFEEVRFESKVLRNSRKIRVYLPHGYPGGTARYPLLIVNGGDEAVKFGAADRVLDNAVGSDVEPLVVAFVPYAGGRTWRETGGPRGGLYAQMVALELLPFLERRYRLRSGPEHRAVMGTGLSGYVSLLATLRFPGVFGKLATQSLYTHNQPVADGLAALIEAPAESAARIYMDWWVAAHEVPAGPGWGTWRARTRLILKTLFPAPQ
jgi:enterochelin esterase family protein